MNNRIVRLVAPVSIVCVLSACGSGSGGPSSTNGGTGASRSSSTTPGASPASGSATSWNASVQNICKTVFDNRGRPDQVDPSNPDAQKAADAKWAAHLQQEAATQLTEVAKASPYGLILKTDLEFAGLLNNDIARIYGKQPQDTAVLSRDRDEFAKNLQSVTQISDSFNTPSCRDIAAQTPQAGG